MHVTNYFQAKKKILESRTRFEPVTSQTPSKYVLYSLSYSESREEQGYSQGPLICDMSLLLSHRSAQKTVLLFEPCWKSQLSRSIPGNFHFVFDCSIIIGVFPNYLQHGYLPYCTHYYPEFLRRIHVVVHLEGLDPLCKVKLYNLLLELHCAPLSISTAASQTNKFNLDPFLFLSFFFFFTRQTFSSALATLKFSKISLSFLLVKEDIFIIKGP